MISRKEGIYRSAIGNDIRRLRFSGLINLSVIFFWRSYLFFYFKLKTPFLLLGDGDKLYFLVVNIGNFMVFK